MRGGNGRSTSSTAFGFPQRDTAVSIDKRTCEHPDCTTVLSRYNADPACWVHAGPTFKTRSAGRHGA